MERPNEAVDVVDAVFELGQGVAVFQRLGLDAFDCCILVVHLGLGRGQIVGEWIVYVSVGELWWLVEVQKMSAIKVYIIFRKGIAVTAF